MKADLIVHNAGQLLTCATGGRPKRGREMNDVGIITDGALAIADGKIAAVGKSAVILGDFASDDVIDAEGKVLTPAFVDPHTHIVFAGNRFDEFELKVKGADYLEILGSGGGIISTVKQTRSADFAALFTASKNRLDRMLECGTTVCEIKTGYGLETETELKMLAVIEELDNSHAIDIVPTFLAAHAIPPEFKGNAVGYADLICDEMLPLSWKWFESSTFIGRVPFFADVFCERNAFSLEQSERVLRAAANLGFELKAHVDQFTNLGGSLLSMNLGAVSIDHLDEISADEIATLSSSNTIGVVTPSVNFNLGSTKFADSRQLIDNGCAVALSTDFNPGSAPCPSQPMSMALALRYQKLLFAEAFNAVTINAAHAIGLGETRGSIEIGKQADLLIFDTDDYRQIAYEFGGNLISKTLIGGESV